MNKLGRRDFLKILGAVSVSGALVSTMLPLRSALTLFGEPQTRLGKKLVKGTASGDFLLSSDDGQSWTKVVGFGDKCVIRQLFTKDGYLYAEIDFDPGHFWLKSDDGLKWVTV